MLNFENIEDLVSHMFANLDNENNLVSVITNKSMTTDIMVELLNYKNVILNSCDIDDNNDYSREYRISLYDNADSDYWYVNVEKDYLVDTGYYLGADGYVLFHECVNSKALIEMQNNKLMSLGTHDWFTVGKEELDNTDTDEDDSNKDTDLDDVSDKAESTDSGYSITVKVGLDTDEAEKIIRDMRKNFQREMSEMIDWLYRPYPYFFGYRPMIFG